jgi:excisionase family DNA binding protein
MSSVKSANVAYLSLREAAKRTQLCVRTLTRAIDARQLRAYRVGRVVRIAELDLQAFMERNPLGARS